MCTRIGIIGAGAIGSVVGGLLTKAGHDVTLIEEETRGFAPARGGVLDHARLGQLISAHRSDPHRPGCLETPV